MGGYAEDALLAELGFTDWETWGEAAPGVPLGRRLEQTQLAGSVGRLHA